jgi:hypothetical protein
MFNISPKSQETLTTDAPLAIKTHSIGMNEKASISNEELNTGIEPTEGATLEDQILSKYSYPGSYPADKLEPAVPKQTTPAYKPLEWGDISKKPSDPTLDYSILLIAKPIPFKFDLKPRDAQRATKMRNLFAEGVQRGEYTDAREYWGENQGRSKPLGWSKV